MTSSNVRQMRSTKVLFICHNHPEVRPGGAEAYALELHRALRGAGRVRAGLPGEGRPAAVAGRTAHTLGTLRQRSPDASRTSTSSTPTTTTTTGRSGRSATTRSSTRSTSRASSSAPARRRALPAHAVLRVRHPAGDPQHAARRGDRLHAARVHADLPPPGPDAAHDRRQLCAWRSRRGAATSASRRSRRRRSSCASASSSRTSPSSTSSSRRARSFATATSTGASRPSRSSSRSTAACRRPARSPMQTRANREPLRLLRPAQPYKGLHVVLEAMRELDADACRGRGRACARRAAGFETGPASGSRAAHVWIHGANLDLQPGDFQNRIDELLELTAADVTFVGAYEHDQAAALMAKVDWVIVPVDLVGELAARDPGGVPFRPARDLQRHRRDGGEGHGRRQRPALPRRRPGQPRRRRCAGRSRRPGLWERLRDGIRPSMAWTSTSRDSPSCTGERRSERKADLARV